MTDLLEAVLSAQPPSFALLYRPEATGLGDVDVLIGEVSTPATVAAIPRPAGREVLAILPYRQLAERGFPCVDDGAPLIAMEVTARAVLPLPEVLSRLPITATQLVNGHFDADDDTYAATVRRIIDDEIGTGSGSNFVVKRSYLADITDFHPATALTFFRRLCERESRAYWTFVVHTGDRTFVGATPERHISLRDGVAVMNPISGTYRYPPGGPTLDGLMEFLNDVKESDELRMVVDEELKMMARICADGGRVVGPYLREMARLAHTEYYLEGRTSRDPRDILAATMFAPTVTGSPLESAYRVITRHEPEGRGYYSGVMALIGAGEEGPELDSAILIRTAEIDAGGRLRVGVGATVVRHSDPASEVAETWAKLAGLLAALDLDQRHRFGDHPEVQAALRGRNGALAQCWLADSPTPVSATPTLAGKRVLVVDAEDTFTAMIALQLRSLGMDVTVRRFDEEYSTDGHDLVVMGPGPGDPLDVGQPRVAHLHDAIRELLVGRIPFLAVCLSHQVLSSLLGLDVRPCAVSNQGKQREIDLFGATERVGFYNTFAAHSDADRLGTVEISRHPETGEVYALRGPRFASVQFHAESVLTQDGPRILATLITGVLALTGAMATEASR